MRRPKATNSPIDKQRISDWVVRFSGYRQDITPRRVAAWMDQFTSTDRDLAARVLDCVNYVSHASMDDAFRRILARLSGWDRTKERRVGKWRFVGFSRAAGESGEAMLHKFRSATGLSSDRYNELFINKRDLVQENLTTADTVVFVDDFAGTGQQVCNGWRDVMAELLPGAPAAYLVLVATSVTASQRIRSGTPLKVESNILLRDDDNIFSPDCTHFTGAEKQNILLYCRRANRRKPQGFGNCGFVIVLAHKTPNNSIPILHAASQKWVPLFPRA